MNNLDKILSSLPKAKLSRRADFRIRLKLYSLLVSSRLKKFLISPRQFGILDKAFIAALIIIVIFGATAIYAYADSSLLPGQRIYPLKIAVERMEQGVAFNSSTKIAVYEKLALRRLQEAASLSQKDEGDDQEEKQLVNENIKKNITAAVVQHEAAVSVIDSLGENDGARVLIDRSEDNDLKKIDYLDEIETYAESRQDDETAQEARKANELINRQEYKHRNRIEDEKTDEKEWDEEDEETSAFSDEDEPREREEDGTELKNESASQERTREMENDRRDSGEDRTEDGDRSEAEED